MHFSSWRQGVSGFKFEHSSSYNDRVKDVGHFSWGGGLEPQNFQSNIYLGIKKGHGYILSFLSVIVKESLNWGPFYGGGSDPQNF